MADSMSPWLKNASPTTNAPLDAIISVDILDDYSGVNPHSLDAYVDGYKVFSGPGTFFTPYNGYASTIVSTSVDGYDGYHLSIDNYGLYDSYSLYSVRVVGKDYYGNAFDEYFSFKTGAYPHIVNIEPNPFEITLDVIFNVPMTNDASLRDPVSYQFNHGMYARDVDIIDPDRIRLWVELFDNHDVFRLTVDTSITSVDGYTFWPGTNVYNIMPFKASAHMTNYNATVRTWRDSNFIQADQNRIYLAGKAGIDIFRKLSSSRITRWGQIFDSYGVEAMHVAHHGGDYKFVDNTAPFLINRDPAPNSNWNNIGPILLTVADVHTAVEITSLRIYVNDADAFRGNFGGFTNGYTGNILAGYKTLVAVIYPPIAFPEGSDVYVRVVATDLLGNELDTIYKFSIGTGGFGTGSFGMFAFGT